MASCPDRAGADASALSLRNPPEHPRRQKDARAARSSNSSRLRLLCNGVMWIRKVMKSGKRKEGRRKKAQTANILNS